MNTPRFIAPWLALAFALTTYAGDKQVSEQDRASIAELLRKHDATLESGDTQGLFALMTDDYVEMSAGTPPLEGKDVARKSLDDFLAKQLLTSFKSDIRDIRISGDWAYVRADNFRLITQKSDGIAREIHGKQMLVLHREKDGSWKIQTNMWNLDAPPKTLH